MPVSVSRHPPTASACRADSPSSGSVLRLKLAYRYWHMIRCSTCAASISRAHRCSRFSTTSSGSDIGAPNMAALPPPNRLTSLHASSAALGAARVVLPGSCRRRCRYPVDGSGLFVAEFQREGGRVLPDVLGPRRSRDGDHMIVLLQQPGERH